MCSNSVFNCDSIDNPQRPVEEFTNFFEGRTPEQENDEEISIKGQIYLNSVILEESDVIIRMVRKDWCQLQNLVLNETAISHEELTGIRNDIAKCLSLIINSLKSCTCDFLKTRHAISIIKQIQATFVPLIIPFSKLDESVLVKLSATSMTNTKCPLYQYLHTFFDVQYHLLLLDYVCGKIEDLKVHLQRIIKDLASLSKTNHRQNNAVFHCHCAKNFWLLIQLFTEKVIGDDVFWTIFNSAVADFDGQFVLWLLKDVAMLQAVSVNEIDRIKPNYVLLESTLKSLLTQTPYHVSLLANLKTIEPLVCHLWLKTAKIETYQVLWEFFSKRLNVSTKPALDYGIADLVELIDRVLWTPRDCDEDFEFFLGMLTAHLGEYQMHWAKMKGRIYSQLGPNKISELNEVGMFHVALLYVVLTKVNFDELAKKFVGFVDNLPAEKKHSQLIWTFYSCFIVRHVRENRSIEAIAPSFIKMLEEASHDKNLYRLLKLFTSDFDNIIKFSSNLQLHQHLLISTWMNKYMTTCHYQDMISLLTILLSTVERVNNDQVWCDWEPAFRSYVYPSLKYVCSALSAPAIGGTLAAKIAVLSPSLMPEAFNFFNSECIVPKVSSSFLCVILENYPNNMIMSPNQEVMAVQSWVKACILTKDSYEELTRNIVKLDVLPSFVKRCIGGAKDPLLAFIDCLSINLKEYTQLIAINKLCDTCFGNADRWISQYLAQPENEAVVLRAFTCVGLAFYKIGPLLYNKHKTTCPYIRLVGSMLLPTELMIGKPLNPWVLQGIKKTWHLFFEATLRLNNGSSNDGFTERTLRDLVVKHVPYFSIVDSPMMQSLDKEGTGGVILDKMANAFFKHPVKEAESNVHKSLRIVNDFVQSTTSVGALTVVIEKALYGLFEVFMFHSQRTTALEVIKRIASSPLYPQVRTEFGNVVISITEKHLAFNTTNYFQLMGILAKFVPSDVKNLFKTIKRQVSNVERMRGVGFDKNLRQHLEKLEAALLQVP